ncbi:MAG: UdgX family uracil-DNA binding protein [Alphaproteobacteria bacterium]|nr:UdgX family uracil-DNA binding protein [Alphaproteobacteria bacterium]
MEHAAEDRPGTLTALAAAEEACTRCPLYRDATQAVPGEGARHAPLMLVGEQPGDKEDIAGHPFVGPAGSLLDRALADAGIDRETTFVTNAVKHFKHENRGKRRLHKRPNASEIDHCRWWLDIERDIVRPRVVVALGATALRSLLGRTVSVSSLRRTVQTMDDQARLVATVHPSSLLRVRDRDDKAAKYADFVEDLTRAAKLICER